MASAVINKQRQKYPITSGGTFSQSQAGWPIHMNGDNIRKKKKKQTDYIWTSLEQFRREVEINYKNGKWIRNGRIYYTEKINKLCISESRRWYGATELKV